MRSKRQSVVRPAKTCARQSGRSKRVAIFLLAVLGPLMPMMAMAAESTPVVSPRATVTLISDVDYVEPGASFRLGLRQKLAPHWHTYWKNPGDAGAPTEIELTMPDGSISGQIDWPGPDGIPLGPAKSFGYENEIVLPVTVTVPADLSPGDRFEVKAKATWLVCEKECIPEEGSFTLDLPVGNVAVPTTGAVAAAFAVADARMPETRPWTAALTEEGPVLVLTLQGDGLSETSVEEAFFFPADWGVVTHAAPQKLAIEDRRLDLVMEKGQTFDPTNEVTGLVALTGKEGSTRWIAISPQINGAIPSGAASEATLGNGRPFSNSQMTGSPPLWEVAILAFLGGLILNLMPCVFPVLAIKATSVANLSGGALKDVRLSGLFYTLGVLFAFVSLASILLVLRAGGDAVGWGFQFQSPLFVAATAWLMLAIGLNLSGVYEIGMTLTGTGQTLIEKPGHAGSFFTGLLAVVVATPCTAPFMGAAVGAALSAPAIIVSLALFAAMGLGLAAPYAVLGLFPRLARLLPRPGIWMLRLKQAMAFPMYGSAAWLVWVLAQQAGDSGILIVLTGALLVGVTAWLYGISQSGTGRNILSRGLAVLSLAALVALTPLLWRLAPALGPASMVAASAKDTGAEPFSMSRLSALRQAGKPVFVNMTAAWCITCLVNERTTLSTETVKQALKNEGITYLKGDWTNQDPDISAFLRSWGRDGLPFYAFYPADRAEPVLLAPVLTEAMVLNEIRRTSVN